MLYICIKFHENISKGFRFDEQTWFPILNFSKGDSVKDVGGVMVHILVLCISPDDALYLYRVT